MRIVQRSPITSMARAMEHSLFARRLCLTPDISVFQLRNGSIPYHTISYRFGLSVQSHRADGARPTGKLDQVRRREAVGADMRPAPGINTPGPDVGRLGAH